MQPHESLVTDGKDIYSINVGRNYRMGESTLPKPPKIKKKKGNLFVQGWLTKEMEEELKPKFGGKKRAKIEMRDAKQTLTEAFKKVNIKKF